MTAVRYALLQATLDVPPIDALQRAFRAVRGLTASDAHTLARDAFGILVRNLDAVTATTLQGALRVEGIETEVVPEPALPVLPAAKTVRRLELSAEALWVFDPLGRKFAVEWKHLMLIVAGQVTLTEFERKSRPAALPGLTRPWGTPDEELGAVPLTEPLAQRRERRRQRPLIELILTRALARYTIQADEGAPLLFTCLGDRRTKDALENYRALVCDLLAAAPHAIPNRGAFFLRQNPPVQFAYPTRNALNEEILWMLWHSRRPAPG